MVLNNGPWSFNNHSLLKRLHQGEQAKEVNLNRLELWVQLYDLPYGFMSQGIGNQIGVFYESDPRNFDGLFKSFMRLKVSMGINKPIPRKMKIKREGESSSSWIHIKYERLPVESWAVERNSTRNHWTAPI